MYILKTSVTKIRSRLRNTNAHNQKKKGYNYPLNVRALWGKLVEIVFIELYRGNLQKENIMSFLDNNDFFHDLRSNGVSLEEIQHFFLYELPAFFEKFNIASVSDLRSKSFNAKFFEEEWGRLPDILSLSGKCDGYYHINQLAEIIEVKTSLGKTITWQIEDIVQITLYAFLAVVTQLKKPINGHPLDIKPELILNRSNLPLMKIYYPPNGYIATYLDFSKIHAINHILSQYIDKESIDLNTYLLKFKMTLGNVLRTGWLTFGDLLEVF